MTTFERPLAANRPGLLTLLVDYTVDRVRGYLRREAAYRELSALDDRMLADIGLTRSELAVVISDTDHGQRPTA